MAIEELARAGPLAVMKDDKGEHWVCGHEIMIKVENEQDGRVLIMTLFQNLWRSSSRMARQVSLFE